MFYKGYSRGVQPKLVFRPQISFFLIFWAAIYQKPKKSRSKYRFFIKFWIQFGPHKNGYLSDWIAPRSLSNSIYFSPTTYSKRAFSMETPGTFYKFLNTKNTIVACPKIMTTIIPQKLCGSPNFRTHHLLIYTQIAQEIIKFWIFVKTNKG